MFENEYLISGKTIGILFKIFANMCILNKEFKKIIL
jgi:hypothetical protein